MRRQIPEENKYETKTRMQKENIRQLFIVSR